MATIKYQNIPFKMPRPDVVGDKFYYMPANNVAINHSAKLNRQAVLAANVPPEMRLAGALETKIQASFPICNKFANNDPSDDSFNFASGVLSYLTGDSPVDLHIGEKVFSGCYLDSCSIKIDPFQSATMSTSFTCTEPVTGVPFLGTGVFASPTGLSPTFAYGHLAEIVGGQEFSDSNQSSISYSVECRRAYSFAVSLNKKTVERVFLDEINKTLSIKATNVDNLISETGIASTIEINLKNESNTEVLPPQSIMISSKGRLNAQNLSINAGGFLNADITIDEAVL